jgi:VIT1/CCC1 family predicted Fe2+/Mn2+ transporter
MSDSQHSEPHQDASSSQLNWLRAAVLGANDGIVSVASIVVGVAGAIDDVRPIIIAGVAGLVAGALSMALGEYVSVSSQRDSERALLAKERYELEHFPEQELEELTKIYEGLGLTRETAEAVAKELTEHDAFGAHVHAELQIDPDDLTNPWHAAFASALSFLSGGILPLIAVALPPEAWRVPVTFVAVLIALIITGVLSAWASRTNVLRATVRMVLGGGLAMLVTYGIGKAFGTVGL